jgi:hypothetical protein
MSFRCALCETTWISRRLLRRHLRYDHRFIAQPDAPPPPPEEAPQGRPEPTNDGKADHREILASPGVSVDFDNGSTENLASVRQGILTEVRQRASAMRRTLQLEVISEPLVARRVQRQRGAIFPPPVPRYRPPHPTPQEVERVKKALFTCSNHSSPEAAGGCRDQHRN